MEQLGRGVESIRINYNFIIRQDGFSWLTAPDGYEFSEVHLDGNYDYAQVGTSNNTGDIFRNSGGTKKNIHAKGLYFSNTNTSMDSEPIGYVVLTKI